MKKKVLHTEISYLLGIILMTFGTALMTKADMGMSMIVAPAYILHLKISTLLPFFSFGMAEYCFQALLLILMCLILKKFKISYLFSFCTAVFYGFTLDLMIFLVDLVPFFGWTSRIIYFLLGLPIVSLSVSLLYHTYLSPVVYELFVMNVSAKFKIDIHKFKWFFDLSFLILAIILSFVFFGFMKFEGVKYGTIICALINGFIIKFFSKFLENHFEFKDALKLRSFFESKK